MTENHDRRVVLFVCGIFTFPGAAANWTARATRWTHQNRPELHAEKIEYFTDILFRNAGQGSRAELLADALTSYRRAGYRIGLVGHSNGADVILDAMLASGVPAEAVVLFAPACAADCRASGLNDITTPRIAIWGGAEDVALWGAGTVIGERFGFGALGRNGPSGYCNSARMTFDRVEGFRHSTFFEPDVFDGWMDLAVGVCFPPVKSL